MNNFQIGPTLSQRQYVNAGWHHDGCGIWVKAFVFLNDVDEQTYPTLIVRGSHRTQWFPTTHHFAGRVAQNKLNDTLVQRTYGRRIHKMLGRKGGGFIFDANALHTASLSGSKLRHTIALDFASVEHLQRMPRGPRGPDDCWASSFTRDLCPFARLPWSESF